MAWPHVRIPADRDLSTDESGGHHVRVDGEILGMAHILRDVTEFLRRAAMDDITEEDVILSRMIDWRGGGPNLWPAPW
ncbi:hypothetical protein [Streptomyces sp. NPDC056661]|uniref:hypothetical protein n=1 Tax=Streptomyces sp. NPDC056661 TaxID=3345898 RepID=UPI0036CFB4C6